MSTSILPKAEPRGPKGLRDASAVLFGRHGIGKSYLMTTFRTSSSARLSIDLEGGTRMMVATSVEPRTWEELLGVLEELETENHTFDTISIDTADRAWSMLEDYVCRQLSVPFVGSATRGKDWALLKAQWSKFVFRVIDLRATDGRKILPFFLCHEKLVPMTEQRGGGAVDTGRSMVTVSLPNSAKVILCSAVDFCFHLYLDEETGKRMLRTQAVDTPAFRVESKGRGMPAVYNDEGEEVRPAMHLPTEIPATFQALRLAFHKAFNHEGEQRDA